MAHLYVLSVHFRSTFWLRVQRRFLDSFLDMPHTRIFAVHEIDAGELLENERAIAYSGSHADGLDLLAKEALKTAQDSDWLLFIDSDSFPIRPFSRYLEEAADFSAVQREENIGDPQPHPSFTLTRAKLFRELGASWRPGFFWFDHYGMRRTDVGAGILQALEEKNHRWVRLNRLNSKDYHPLFFAVYGPRASLPVVYHHGAGSRTGINRAEKILRRKRPLHYRWYKILFLIRTVLLVVRLGEPMLFFGGTQERLGDRAFRLLISRTQDFWLEVAQEMESKAE